MVLARDSALPALRRPLVAPLTTTIRGIPTEVTLDEDDGLPQPCVVSLDNVQPLALPLLTERITRLGPDRMAAACRALTFAVDCV